MAGKTLRLRVVDLLGVMVDHADAEVAAKDTRTKGDRNFMVDDVGR